MVALFLVLFLLTLWLNDYLIEELFLTLFWFWTFSLMPGFLSLRIFMGHIIAFPKLKDTCTLCPKELCTCNFSQFQIHMLQWIWNLITKLLQNYSYCIRSVEFHASVQCKQSTIIEDIHSQKTWIQMIRHFDFPKFLPRMFIANFSNMNGLSWVLSPI